MWDFSGFVSQQRWMGRDFFWIIWMRAVWSDIKFVDVGVHSAKFLLAGGHSWRTFKELWYTLLGANFYSLIPCSSGSSEH